ncbi:MAG: serine/threonine protein kinase [Candidatus Bathyarchaeota archaeon]|nr:serine/threonine protein kinase [Candidatus Bathyarchaeota archaeon]
MNDYIPVKKALEHKIGEFLCWPQFNQEEAEQRVEQLVALGVESIAIGGPHGVLGTPILGKGHAGVVIRAMYQGQEVALKARRTDTRRGSMSREAGFLEHVNQWDAGPKLYGFSEDFIVMELLVGPYFGDWVKTHIDDRKAVIKNIKAILDIAWRLDQSSLDHGELTRIRRHYIVTKEGPRVIDFESASFDRQPSNLTCTVQSLFMNTSFAGFYGKHYSLPNREALIEALRAYKTEPNLDHYQEILSVCNLG